jgi:hypothetical protein
MGEATLREALGDAAAAAHLAPMQMATALYPLLIVLLEQEGITDDQMDRFFADVLPLAEAWLARQQPIAKEP